jgi:hypothetical protein
MWRRTPIPIYSGSALFRWLDKQFNACSTRCVGSGCGSFYRHTPACQTRTCPVGARLRTKTSGYSDLGTDPKLIFGLRKPI